MATAADAVDVILRDGRTLRLRPPRLDDAESLLEFFRSLSEQSLYMRFHGFPQRRGAARRAAARSGLGRARRPARRRSPSTAASVWSPSPTTCACATRPRRGGIRSRGQTPEARDRHAAARAARRPRREGRHRALRRRGAARQPQHARRVRGRRLRALARVRGRRGRGRVPDRVDGGATASGSRSATTLPSRRRCVRSSSRRASPSSAHRGGAARSAASSSATSSRATSPAPRTR